MTRVAIIGNGIAGTTTAHWLHQSDPNIQITLFEANDPLAASFGQTLLVHPFPGRSLIPHEYLGDAVEQLQIFLEFWRNRYPDLIRSCSMWRPMKGSNAQRLEQSWYDWWTPKGKHAQSNPWHSSPPNIYRLSDTDFFEHPSHKTPYETLSTDPAYMVDAGELFPRIHRTWNHSTINVIQSTVQSLHADGSKWRIQTNSDDAISPFDQVVLAIGRHSKEWFPHLELTLQGGSLLRFKPQSTSRIPALSLDGLHVGQHHSGDWVIGSTRWSTPPTDINAETQTLMNKLKQTLPQAPPMFEKNSSLWSGMRTIYPSDRMPLCGQLPQHRNVFVVTALGSKGWLWGPWASKCLTQRMQNPSHTIPTCIDLMRANMEDGWYSPKITSSRFGSLS